MSTFEDDVLWDEEGYDYGDGGDEVPADLDEIIGPVDKTDMAEIEALARALVMEDPDFETADDDVPDEIAYEALCESDVEKVFPDPVGLTPKDCHAAAVARSLPAEWGHPEVIRCHLPLHKRTTSEGEVVLAGILDSLGLVPVESSPRYLTVMTDPRLLWRPKMEQGLLMGLGVAAPCLAEGSRLDIEVPCRVTLDSGTVDILATHVFYLGRNHEFRTYEPTAYWAEERRRDLVIPIRRDLAGRPTVTALWEEP